MKLKPSANSIARDSKQRKFRKLEIAEHDGSVPNEFRPAGLRGLGAGTRRTSEWAEMHLPKVRSRPNFFNRTSKFSCNAEPVPGIPEPNLKIVLGEQPPFIPFGCGAVLG